VISSTSYTSEPATSIIIFGSRAKGDANRPESLAHNYNYNMIIGTNTAEENRSQFGDSIRYYVIFIMFKTLI